MSDVTALPPADRFALIIEGLCQAVARRGGARRGGGLAGFAAPLIVLIWTRLRRIAFRFARDAATHPAPSRPADASGVTPHAIAKRPPRQSPYQPHPLPRRKAWLIRLVPETASGAAQFRHFLADPEVASLLEAAPRLGRILRPLCRMLGIRPAQARCLYAVRMPDDAAPVAHPIPGHTPPQAEPAAPAAVPLQATPPPPRWPRAA